MVTEREAPILVAYDRFGGRFGGTRLPSGLDSLEE